MNFHLRPIGRWLMALPGRPGPVFPSVTPRTRRDRPGFAGMLVLATRGGGG